MMRNRINRLPNLWMSSTKDIYFQLHTNDIQTFSERATHAICSRCFCKKPMRTLKSLLSMIVQIPFFVVKFFTNMSMLYYLSPGQGNRLLEYGPTRHAWPCKELYNLAYIYTVGTKISVANLWLLTMTQEGVHVVGFEVPPSPDSSYDNPVPGNEDEGREPPLMPPHLQHTLLSFPPSQDESSPLPQPQTVVLNHLYIEKENTRSMVALGITHRFKAKFVTVVLYKPVLRR